MKKNTRIRAAALVLTAIAAAGVYAGGSKQPESAGGAAPGRRNLGGINVILANWYSDYDVNTYKADSTPAERTLAWRTQIQRDYNFTMREKAVAGYNEMMELTVSSIMAGAPAGSILNLEASWLTTLHNQGLLYPLGDCRSVDLSKTDAVEWNQMYKEALTFNGKIYGVSIGSGTGARGHGVYFNKRLFREAGVDPELPYNMQKAGTWTWAALLDLCKKLTRDTNNDGIVDIYAIAAGDQNALDAITVSNGAYYVDRDPSGRFVNGMTRPEFTQAFQFAIRLNTEKVVFPVPQNAEWNWHMLAFADAKAAMTIGPEWERSSFQDMKDDWGYVLFPKGPRAADYRVLMDQTMYAIPSTFSPEEADRILYAFYLWNSPAPGNNTPGEWKTGLYTVYRDARAVDETMAMVRDPKHSQIAYFMFIPDFASYHFSGTIWQDGVDPAKVIEEYAPRLESMLSKVNPAGGGR